MKEFEAYWLKWLRHWHDLVDPGGPDWTDGYCAAGMLNALWNDRLRIRRCLSPLPKAERLSARIDEIIDAALSGSAAPPGLYYAVRNPLPASDHELQKWAALFYQACRQLTGIPDAEPAITVVRSTDPVAAYLADSQEGDNAPHEELDDLASEVLSHCPIEERAAYHLLEEPLYTMACTYALVEYVRWVFVEDGVGEVNPYLYQFNIWRSGALERFRLDQGVTIFARPKAAHTDN